MIGYFILLIILVITDIICTVFYANKLENIMRMLKNNTTDQTILSESRIKERIDMIKSEGRK